MTRLEDLARAAYETFNSGNFDATVELFAPDVELVRPSGLGIVRGREAVRQFLAPDAFASQRIEPVEFMERGERLFVALRGWARGAGSGIELETPGFHVFETRDGQVTRLQFFFDRAEALEAFEDG
jgi:ketosteroid isomerase-like protein